MKIFSMTTAAAGAVALMFATISAQASVVTVSIHDPSPADIAADPGVAGGKVIDLLIDSQTDLVLSYDINLTTTGTIFQGASAGVGADSHVSFGTILGGDLTSPVFPLSVGAPLPIQTHNGLVARITVLGDASPTIDGTVFVSTDGITSTSIVYDSTPTAIVGDLDLDGFVGITDLNLVLANWNATVTPGDPADPSGDGFIGIQDLNVVLGNWNAGTPPAAAAVPEPGSLALLATSLLMIRRSRRCVA